MENTTKLELLFPVTVNGTVYQSLNIRRSKVKDRLAVSKLNLMRTSAMQGKPLMLISGYGFAFGQWCITSVQENQTIFFKDGTPRRIDFTINLKKYGDDKKRGIMGIVQKVGKYL